jgi:hypothetical protein
MKNLVAIILALREAPFIVPCLQAIYKEVKRIVLISAYDRTLKGDRVSADRTLELALEFPDPERKLFILLTRYFKGTPAITEDAMRNFAMQTQPDADYFLIVDPDEIHEQDRLQEAWRIVATHQPAWARIPCHTYFKKWNYRVRSKDLCSPIVFLRKGYLLQSERGLKRLSRLKRLIRWGRTGHYPRELRLPDALAFHHGSYLGEDERILAKTQYGGYASQARPQWYENYWVNFHPQMTNFHPVRDDDYFESLETIPTKDLPSEIRLASWPEGWLL